MNRIAQSDILMIKIAIAFIIAPFLCVLLIGAAIYRSGLLIVDVQNKMNGDRLYMPVPMVLVNFVAGMNAPPLQNFRRNIGPLGNTNLQAAFDAVAECPNTTFIEVENDQRSLVIAKKGGSLTIHAESEKDIIDIKVPIRSAEKALAKLSAEF